MAVLCRLRAIHNWVIYLAGQPFDWMLGHTCQESADGNFRCNWCDFVMYKDQIAYPEDYEE